MRLSVAWSLALSALVVLSSSSCGLSFGIDLPSNSEGSDRSPEPDDQSAPDDNLGDGDIISHPPNGAGGLGTGGALGSGGASGDQEDCSLGGYAGQVPWHLMSRCP